MNFRSKIWPRHSLRRPRFPIWQMHFHYRVTFTGYIRCFRATTSHDLVTLTFDLLTLSVSCRVLLMSDPHTNFYYPIYVYRLLSYEYWISDHISVIWNSHCACAISCDLCIGGPPKPHVTIFDPELPIHYTTFMRLRWRLRVVYIGASPCQSGFRS